MGSPDGVGIEPEAGHDPGPEALDQDVGLAGQLPRPVAVVGFLEVERDAALAGVHRVEELGVVAHRVAAGWFHLEDVGPQLAQE